MYRLKKILEFADNWNLYPDLKTVEGPADPEVVIDGKKVLMFSSNNYLGLSNHPRVVKAGIEAIKKYGVGSDGSRLLSGNLKIHREFEEAIAKFKGAEDAIVWPTGYSANVGVISAVMYPLKVGLIDVFHLDGVILSDELNHASIIDGARMSKQKKVVFKHRDISDLEKKLKSYRWRRKLVVTDSVFSMDGDIAPLDKMTELCKKYDAMLMIDEAHATGILGKTGHGSLEHFNLKPTTDVDVVLGTCSKALASSGGFVVGSKELADYLRVASRAYMFSTAMMPAASGALIAALHVMETEPKWREQLWINVKHAMQSLEEAGFNTLESETQIIPIFIGDDKKAIQFSRKLFEKGIFAPAVRWPAVPKDTARLRITLMATHTKDQIDYFVKSCKEISAKLQ